MVRTSRVSVPLLRQPAGGTELLAQIESGTAVGGVERNIDEGCYEGVRRGQCGGLIGAADGMHAKAKAKQQIAQAVASSFVWVEHQHLGL